MATRVKRPKSKCFFGLQRLLLTWHYLFGGSRWFLFKEYTKKTTYNICLVRYTCLKWLKQPPKHGNFSKKVICIPVWCLFKNILVIMFGNIFYHKQSHKINNVMSGKRLKSIFFSFFLDLLSGLTHICFSSQVYF